MREASEIRFMSIPSQKSIPADASAAAPAAPAARRADSFLGDSFLCGEQLAKFGDDPIAAAAILGFRRRRNFLDQFYG